MKLRTLCACTIVALIGLSGTPALAASSDDGKESENSNGADYRVSALVSGFNLLKPVLSDEQVSYAPEVQLHGEVRLFDSFSTAAVLTYGSASSQFGDAQVDFGIYRAGLQALFYPLGNFDRGMQVGIQGLYETTSFDEQVDGVQLRAGVDGVSLAVLVGYKLIVDPGFTIGAQLGGGPHFLEGSAAASVGDVEASTSSNTIRPKVVVNLNLGWSF